MHQILSCPDCGRKLRVPDNLLGKKVKCPSCGVKFVGEVEEELDELEEIQAPPPPARRPRDAGVVEKPSKSRRGHDEEREEAHLTHRRSREEEPEDEEESEPQKQKPKKKEIYQGWERVLFGLNLVAISIWIGVGGKVVFFIASLVLSSSASAAMASGTGVAPGAQALAGALLALAAIIDFACIGVQTTGFGFCMGVVATPRTLVLKVLAVAAFFMAVVGVISAVVYYGADRVLGQRGGALITSGAGLAMVLLPLGELLCFLFFMRGVAVVMRKDDLARAVVTFMITIAACIGLFVVALVVLIFAGMVAMNTVGASPASPPGSGHNAAYGIVACGASLLLLGVFIALLIRFMSLLYQVRSAVGHWLDRN